MTEAIDAMVTELFFLDYPAQIQDLDQCREIVRRHMAAAPTAVSEGLADCTADLRASVDDLRASVDEALSLLEAATAAMERITHRLVKEP